MPKKFYPTVLGVFTAFGNPTVPPNRNHSDVWNVIFFEPNYQWVTREIPVRRFNIDYLGISVENGVLAMLECEVFLTHSEYLQITNSKLHSVDGSRMMVNLQYVKS